LLERVADEIFNELKVVRAVCINTRFAIAAHMSEIGSRRNVSRVVNRQHLGIDRGDAGAPAAADSLGTAVPSTLDPAVSAVRRAQRQSDEYVDVLVRIRPIKDFYETIGGIRPTRRDLLAAHRFDSRVASQSACGIGRQRRAGQ
jgi:hypothetical protein